MAVTVSLLKLSLFLQVQIDLLLSEKLFVDLRLVLEQFAVLFLVLFKAIAQVLVLVDLLLEEILGFPHLLVYFGDYLVVLLHREQRHLKTVIVLRHLEPLVRLRHDLVLEALILVRMFVVLDCQVKALLVEVSELLASLDRANVVLRLLHLHVRLTRVLQV